MKGGAFVGLKAALLDAVVTKTLRTIATSGEIKDSKITTQSKRGEVSPAYEYIKKSSLKCFLLESGFFDMYSLNEFCGSEKLRYYDYDGKYKVFSKNEKLRFLVLEKRMGLGEELIGRDLDKRFLFDIHGNVCGRIKEHLIALHEPITENSVKSCSVVLGEDKLCNVRRYYKLGKEHFEISDDYTIKHDKNKVFIIKKEGKQIAKITIFRANIKKVLPRSIVVEYDDVKEETTVLLFAMAIDSVCYY